MDGMQKAFEEGIQSKMIEGTKQLVGVAKDKIAKATKKGDLRTLIFHNGIHERCQAILSTRSDGTPCYLVYEPTLA